jgi:hypothetical protein
LDKGIFSQDCNDKQKLRLVYRAKPYTLISGILYKKSKDEILRQCISSFDPQRLSLYKKRYNLAIGSQLCSKMLLDMLKSVTHAEEWANQ